MREPTVTPFGSESFIIDSHKGSGVGASTLLAIADLGRFSRVLDIFHVASHVSAENSHHYDFCLLLESVWPSSVEYLLNSHHHPFPSHYPRLVPEHFP